MDVKTSLKMILEGSYLSESAGDIDAKLVNTISAIKVPNVAGLKYVNFELFDNFDMTVFFFNAAQSEVAKSASLKYYKEGMVIDGVTIEDASRDFDIIFKHFRKHFLKSTHHKHGSVSFVMQYHDTYPVQVLDR